LQRMRHAALPPIALPAPAPPRRSSNGKAIIGKFCAKVR
jgi:hypothetical protein